jgi:hypothetical protein
VIAVILPRAWARDRNAAGMFLGAMLSLPLFVGGATVALFDGAARVKALGLFTATLLAVGFLGRVLWEERHLVDLLPHWLLAKFSRDAIFEDDGVQWAIQRTGADVGLGASVVVYLQNNIDAQRDVTLRLRDESGFWLRSGRITFPIAEPVVLPPRAHAVVTIPLIPTTDRALGKVRVYVMLDAGGPAGPRNRGWRAPTGPRPLSKWLVALGPLGGVFIWRRGGVFVSLISSGGFPSSAHPRDAQVTLI